MSLQPGQEIQKVMSCPEQGAQSAYASLQALLKDDLDHSRNLKAAPNPFYN